MPTHEERPFTRRFASLLASYLIPTLFGIRFTYRRYDYEHPTGKGYDESPFESSWFCAVRGEMWGKVREGMEGWGGEIVEGGGKGGKRMSSKRRKKIKGRKGGEGGDGEDGGGGGVEGIERKGGGYGNNQRRHNEAKKKRKSGGEEGRKGEREKVRKRGGGNEGSAEERSDEGEGGKSKYRNKIGKRVKRRF